MWPKIFRYKVFVHGELKLLNFLMDSVLNTFSCPIQAVDICL